MTNVILDCLKINDEGHSYLKQQFDFNENYGSNLDALYDFLTDFNELTIILLNAEQANEQTKKIIHVLHLAEKNTKRIEIVQFDEKDYK